MARADTLASLGILARTKMLFNVVVGAFWLFGFVFQSTQSNVAFSFRWISDAHSCKGLPCKVFFAMCHGLVFQECGAREPVLATALKQRRDFSKWELVKAVEAFELDACSEETQQRSHRQLLEDLILHVFPGRPDLQAEIKAEYDKPPEVNHEDIEIDEEMQQLLMEWNSIKQSAKGYQNGKFWRSVIRFSSIANLNHGPYRSSAWGKMKQESHADFMAKHTMASEEFRRAARMTAWLLGQDIDDAGDWAPFWQRLSTLPSCHESGPALKFARWMSIQEVWKYYREELFFLKEIVLNMSKDGDRLQQVDSTQLLDPDLAYHMTSDPEGGLLARVPVYICPELVDSMDIFAGVTSILGNIFSDRTHSIKTPEQGVEVKVADACGGYQQEFIDVITLVLRDATFLKQIGAIHGGARAVRNCKDLGGLTLHLFSERVSRVIPNFVGYPNQSIVVLSKDREIGRGAVGLVLATSRCD